MTTKKRTKQKDNEYKTKYHTVQTVQKSY